MSKHLHAPCDRPPAKGTSRRPGENRIVVSLDDEMFAEVARRAEQNRTSFAEQVRTLIEWGLEADA